MLRSSSDNLLAGAWSACFRLSIDPSSFSQRSRVRREIPSNSQALRFVAPATQASVISLMACKRSSVTISRPLEPQRVSPLFFSKPIARLFPPVLCFCVAGLALSPYFQLLMPLTQLDFLIFSDLYPVT